MTVAQISRMVDVFRQPVHRTDRPMVPVSRINEVPHTLDPLMQGLSFVLHGHVYHVVKDKTRGRHMIRHLGIAQA